MKFLSSFFKSESLENTVKFLSKVESNTIFYPMLLVFLCSILFGRFLYSEGSYGMYSDWPIPPLREQLEDQVTQDVFYAWSPNYLGYERVRQTGNYVDLTTLVISRVFSVGGEVISKYPIVMLFVVPLIAFFALTRFGLKRFFAFVGAVFYSFCVPLLFDSLISGYLKFIISYAFFPLFMLYLSRVVFLDKFCFKQLIYLTLSYVLVSTTINFFFIVLIAVGVFSAFALAESDTKLRKLFTILLQFSFACLLVVMVQATAFFLPLYEIFTRSSDNPIDSLQSGLITFLTFSHPVILNAFRQFSASINFFERNYPTYGKALLFSNFYFAVLLFLVYISPLFASGKKSLTVKAIFSISVLSIFILKGINQPFGGINKLFYEVPLMAVLRNISYVTILTAFSYAFLFSYSSQKLQDRFFKNIWISRLFSTSLLLLLYVGSYPLRNVNLFSSLETFKVHPEEKDIYSRIRSEDGTFYVYNLPSLSPFYYKDSDGKILGPGFNPFISNPAKPSFYSGMLMIGNVHRYTAFINNSLFYRDLESLVPLMRLGNVKYIVVNSNFESVFPQFINTRDNKWFKSVNLLQNILDNKNLTELDMVTTLSAGSIKTYGLPNYENTNITFTDGLFLNLGGYRSFLDQHYLFNKQYDAVFANDYDSSHESILKFVQFSQTGKLDLVATLIEREYKYQPGAYVDKNRNDPTREWAQIYRGEYWWYDYVLPGEEESILVIEAESDRYSFPVNLEVGKTYLLLAKLLYSESGTEVTFNLNSSNIGSVHTKSDKYTGVKYTEVGLFTADSLENKLNIISGGGTNSVYEITVVPIDIYSRAEKEANSLLERLPFFLSYTAGLGGGIGAESSLFDFYYSRERDVASGSRSVSIDIPKPGLYDMKARVTREEVILSENLQSEYFLPVKEGEPLLQKIFVDSGASYAEFCFSVTYISEDEKNPSSDIPENPLLVSYWSNVTAKDVSTYNVKPAKVYTEGDWLYYCIPIGAIKSDYEMTFSFSSDARGVLWALPYLTDESSDTGYLLKYRLSGTNDHPNFSLKATYNNKSMERPYNFSDNTVVNIFENRFLPEGNLDLQFECVGKCVVDRVYVYPTGSAESFSTLQDPYILPKSTYEDRTQNLFKFNTVPYTEGVLIFKQSYNPAWMLMSDSARVKSHLIVNGYQNGWVVAGIAGSQFSGELFFTKQTIYNFANVVAISAFLVLCLVAVYVYLVYRDKGRYDE